MVADVRMLASLRMRRLGRQWARLNLGVDGRRAMAQYQLAATELAMACNRNSFGRTTEEAYARHRDDSLELMRAAAAVVRGTSSSTSRPGSAPPPRCSSLPRLAHRPQPASHAAACRARGRLAERAPAAPRPAAERRPLVLQQPLLALEPPP